MSTMQQRHAVYAAYAELESAAEAFYNASNAMSAALREINEHDTVERLNTVCEDINCVMVNIDTELDEVI
jgi:hypothetical protein